MLAESPNSCLKIFCFGLPEGTALSFKIGGKMKKKIYFILFFVILFSLTLSASLLDVYKSGKIKLVPDPNFGKGTDWDIYFPQGIKDIAFAKDGSFFATGFGNKACHCVYKFDKDGKFLKKIGRKGRGPGDLYHPGALSILDNKYLLVADYPLNMKISVFDLNGKYLKTIRTKKTVYDIVGLKHNVLFYLSERFGDYNVFSIYMKNIISGKETLIKKYKEKAIKSSVQAPQYYGDAFIKKIGNENLLISFNNSKDVFIYSSLGKLLKSFKIKRKKRRISEEEKDSFYKIMEKNAKKYPVYKRIIKKMYRMKIFPEYAPYYLNILTDKERNILIFPEISYVKTKKIKFDIYDKNGVFYLSAIFVLKERIDKTEFERVLSFNNGYLYFPSHKDDNFILCRVKIKRLKKEKIK